MASFGILFDIKALGGGAYGYKAYCILFQAVRPQQLAYCQLSDGDIDSEHYCIAIECEDLEKIAELRSVLAACNTPGLMPPSSRFLDGTQVERLPLVRSAYAIGAGELMEFTPGWAKSAWNDTVLSTLSEPAKTSSDTEDVIPGKTIETRSVISSTLTLDKKSETAQKSSRSEATVTDKPASPGEYMPGDVIGPHYYVRAVHRGGMGLVYIVDSLSMLRKGKSLLLALKTFQDRFLWKEDVIGRFEREAMQWIGLEQHPHIVTAFFVERIEGRPYIKLEYVDGGSLADRLAHEMLNTSQAINFAIQFARGMDHAYEKHGLIHRDIKPANCLLTHDGVLKISDFGLSKFRAELLAQTGDPMLSPISSTQVGFLIGTPIYMAPEAIIDPGNVDVRADIYSFGIMFHEMLTGHPVFFRDNVLQQHLHEKPAEPSAFNPDVPRALDEVVLKCLEKNPDKRFVSFAELEAALIEVGTKFTGAIPELPEHALVEEKDRLSMKAFSLMEFGRFKEAITVFREVVSLKPNDAEIRNNLGVCLALLGHFEEAFESTKRAVELKPDYVEAWTNLGGILNKLGRYQEGIEACDQAIFLNSNWAEAHANRGVNLTCLDRFDEAISNFELALQADPKYWKGYLMKAEALARRGESPEKILPLIERALDIHPRDAHALAIAAVCLKDMGRTDEANRYLYLAKTVAPHDPFVLRAEEAFARKY